MLVASLHGCNVASLLVRRRLRRRLCLVNRKAEVGGHRLEHEVNSHRFDLDKHPFFHLLFFRGVLGFLAGRGAVCIFSRAPSLGQAT